MADSKFTELTETTTVVGDDLFAVAVDVAGTPDNKKLTVTNLFAGVPANTVINGTFEMNSNQGMVLGNAANTITSNTATGQIGTFTFDATHMYLCVATNTWKRIPLEVFS